MIKVAINGFGRIGRNIFRALHEAGLTDQINIVAINEIASPEGIIHLLKYDTSHGRFRFPVELKEQSIEVAGYKTRLLHNEKIEDCPWRELEIDLVMECTGLFSSREDGEKHLNAGAKKVLFSQPCKPDMDATVIYGVNDDLLKPEHIIVSNGSCTTNCIVPVISVLDKHFGIESGTITTIHASMHDQQVIDAYHPDLRRTRAASQSIIPVDTKLALGIERILPKFAGRFEAIAVRVPTINVTAMDLSVTLEKEASIACINEVLSTAGVDRLAGILSYTEEPLVSCDFNHDAHSCIVDGSQTRVSHKTLVKTLVWCDNEWGFANRMLDTCKAMFDQ